MHVTVHLPDNAKLCFKNKEVLEQLVFKPPNINIGMVKTFAKS